MKQGKSDCRTKMSRDNLSSAIAKLGGILNILGLTGVLFLRGYQSFVLDKSLMKRLYAEDAYVTNGRNERSDEEEFYNKISNRKAYQFSYCGYVCTSLQRHIFCCLKPCYSQSGREKYDRRMKSFEKFEKAREKLSMERDIEDFISQKRVLKLLTKVVLSHK